MKHYFYRSHIMKTSLTSLIFAGLIIFSSWNFLQAQETQIMVRAKAKDAKFIATSIGGAEIIIKDSKSGKVLDRGITDGTTGNTEIIMKKDHQRRTDLSDEKTGGFLAKLAIKEPTLLTIEAHAPVNAKQAEVISSTQIWALPEKHILGDGVVLEVPGFIVDIINPQRHSTHESGKSLEIKANVVMMCGCPTSPGGIWDSEDYEIRAVITHEGEKLQEKELTYTGELNTFSTEIKELDPGFYTLTVYVYDAETGNTGVDKTNLIIR